MKQVQFGNIGVLTNIRGLYDGLNPAERILADYILRHSEQVVQITIEGLVEAAGVSYSTICRFCKRLGLSGYKEFRNALAKELLQQPVLADLDIARYEVSRGNSTQQVCESTFRMYTGVLNDCASLLNLEVVEQAVQAIISARMLHIIGAGASAASAMYAYTRFLRLGIPCAFEYDPVIYHMKTAIMDRQDVLIAVSSSGRTQPVIKAARLAKESRATVIAVGDYCNAPLHKYSDINLYTTSRNAAVNSEIDLPLTVGQIAIIDIVSSCCISVLGEHGSRLYESTKQAVEASKNML